MKQSVPLPHESPLNPDNNPTGISHYSRGTVEKSQPVVSKNPSPEKPALVPFEASLDAFRAFATASSGVLYRMNADWTEMYNLKGMEFIADTQNPDQSWLDKYIPLEEQSRVWSVVQDAIRTKHTFELEHQVFQVDGTVGWTFSRAVPLFDEQNEIVEWFGVANDITERKQAEARLKVLNEHLEAVVAEQTTALRDREDRYHTLFESIDEGFCIIEVIFDEQDKPIDYRFIETNQAFEKQTGLVNATGKRVRDLIPLHEDYWFEIYGRVARTGQSERFENEAKQLNRWYDVYAFPYGDNYVGVLFNDVMPRKRVEEQLRQAVQSRDDFLSVAAHELKTPITSLRGFAQILLRRLRKGVAIEPDQLQHSLERIDRQSYRLGVLVSQLLDVSRLDAGRLVLDYQRTDLVALVRTVASTIQHDTQQHPITIEAPAALDISIDPMRVEQVLVNLLNNAIKYSPDGGAINISVYWQEHNACVSVTDYGIGIPVERRPHIFERFYQGHGNGYLGGMGIGLFISHQIAELHGGSLTAEFPEDVSTRLVLCLPDKKFG